MRVAEIGDNCIDVYERIGKKYPTGNVVDTGVNLQKLGIPVFTIAHTILAGALIIIRNII